MRDPTMTRPVKLDPAPYMPGKAVERFYKGSWIPAFEICGIRGFPDENGRVIWETLDGEFLSQDDIALCPKR